MQTSRSEKALPKMRMMKHEAGTAFEMGFGARARRRSTAAEDGGTTESYDTTDYDRSPGAPPADASASSEQASGAARPRFGEITIRDRGRLPHWEKEGAAYFI